jgi:hypothetical protein
VEGTRGEVGQHRGTRAVVLEATAGSNVDGGGLSACMHSKRWTTSAHSVVMLGGR